MLWSKFARRYLLSPKSHSVINIIASISVLSVAAPVAAMIVLLSIFNGLEQTVERMYSSFDADVVITPSRGQTFAMPHDAVTRLEAVEGVEAAAPYLEQMVVVSASGRRTTVTLLGVDSTYISVAPLDEYMVRGEYRLLGERDTATMRRRDVLVAGYGVAAELGMPRLDGDVELYAVNRRQFSSLLPTAGISRLRAALGGVFMVNADIDRRYVLCDLDAARRLLNYPGRISHMALRLGAGADRERVRSRVETIFGEGYDIRTRDQKNDSLLRIMAYEKRSIFIIAFMVTLVAAFSLVGAVVMLLTDKRRDMATLRALGMTRRYVSRIFVGEGMLITLAGGGAGILAGLALCWAQRRYDLVAIPGATTVGSYPVSIEWADVAATAAAVVVVGYVVSRLTVASVMKRKSRL